MNSQIFGRKAITKIQAIVIAAIIIIAAVAAASAYYLAFQPSGKSTNEVVIGRILPLTGPLAYEAWMAHEAYDVALQRINEAGGIKSMGNATLRFVDGDSQDTTDVAVAEFEKLRTLYNPSVFLDGWSSAMTIAIGKQADKYKIPIFSISAMSPVLTQQGWQYFFRMAPLSDDYVKGVFDCIAYINQQYPQNKIKTAAIVYETTLSGQSVRDSIQNFSASYNINVILSQGVDVGTKDFSALIVQLKAAAPDALLMYLGSSDDAALLGRQWTELGFYCKFISGFSGVGPGTTDFIDKLGGQEQAKSYYICQGTSINPKYNSTEYTWVLNKYISMHPDATAIPENWLCFYAGFFVLRDALEAAGKLHPSNPLAPDSIRDAFKSLDIEDPAHPACIYQRYKTDDKGDNALRAAVITQIINGTLEGVFPLYAANAQLVYPYPTG